jgi:hypothetical protein
VGLYKRWTQLTHSAWKDLVSTLDPGLVSSICFQIQLVPLQHGLNQLITAAGLDPEDYVDKLLAGRVTAKLLPKTPTEVSCAGIPIGDALELCEAIAAVPAIEVEAILAQ